MQTESMSDYIVAAQQIFKIPAVFVEAAEANTRSFWKSQDKLLDEMKSFTDAWFERRHKGTQAALETGERMLKAPTPVDACREYQDWAKGAFERVVADSLTCQQLLAMMAVRVRPIAPGVEKVAEEAQASVGLRPRSKAA